MISRGDLNQLSQATQARDALAQVRQREQYGQAVASQAAGMRYKIQSQARRSPIYNTSGKLFLGQTLRQDLALTVPQDVEEGSVLEYHDDQSGKYHYGRVTQKNKQGKIEVENISKEEVDDLVGPNSPTKIYSLDRSDISSQGSKMMSSLMSLLDPSENLVFKLLTLLLVGNIFETDSVTDIFMAVYLRIIGLAISIITIVYVSTTFFG